MNRVRVKICGITRPADGVMVAQAGADAIGLVFYQQSQRFVSVENANRIIRELPPFISTVGLFVNSTASEIRSVLSYVNLDILQFHGEERPEDCSQFGKPWLKAIRMQAGVNLPKLAEDYAHSSGLLLDSYVPGQAGGTGQTFDWNTVSKGLKKPVILAGGLHSANVKEAILKLSPYAVDVSTGVESDIGIKESIKVAGFIRQVRETDCE